jgi:predicted RNA-binding protein with PUA-like domain
LVDPSQFDTSSKYFDPSATPEKPRWDCVKLSYIRHFERLLSLDSLRDNFSPDELGVVKRGNRLSILPVSPISAERLLSLLDAA